jgi:OmpA-OmpF porin, OOP family
MKKLVFSSLIAATLLGASDFNYEVTPVVGYLWNSTSNETNLNNGGAMGGLDNHIVYGAEVQMNNVCDLIKPELSILYGRDRAMGQDSKTGVLTTMLNGVYEMPTASSVTPFAKAGFGYEWYTNTHPTDFDGLILDAGLGLKAEITKQIALKLEALYLYKMNNNGIDGSNGEVHNVAALAGLTFSFDEKAVPATVAAVAAPAAVAVVSTSKPEPKPVVVPAPKAAAPIDSDKDGVFDPQDKCPGTPSGFKVDAEGCPIKATLHLNFKFDTDTVVDADGTAKVTSFANFMKESPAYNANIVGHTDSVGTDTYNQKLSEKRAVIVKSMLVERGVDASRLSTAGKGESSPVATNKTKEGRAENRRIEVDLTH